MTLPTLFISYSSRDARWKDRLIRHLAVYEHEAFLQVWHDGLIPAGTNWLPEIEAGISEASVAVLLVSAEFLTSEFVLRNEVSALLERRQHEGLRMIPLIVSPCDWRKVPWLAAIEVVPELGKPLADLRMAEADEEISRLAERVSELLEQREASPGARRWERGAAISIGITELAAAVDARVPNLGERKAAAFVEALFRAITNALARSGQVSIPGFGTFLLTKPPLVKKKTTAAKLVYAKTSRGGSPRSRSRSWPPPPRIRFLPSPPEDRCAVVEVFFATDRRPTRRREAVRAFGTERGAGELHYGSCQVSVPHRHTPGQLESPSILRLELRPDPTRHIVLMRLDISPREEFFATVAQRCGTLHRKELLVFIHGFNVRFSDAVRRTAQVAYDLRFQGLPVLYSWPSRCLPQILAYPHDENSVAWTEPHLLKFLIELKELSKAENLHIIAHSMGSRALTAALERIALSLAVATPLFSQVIFTAPDLDAGVFRGLAARLRSIAQRVTLYGSENDRALRASKLFHGGYPRAGDGGDNLVVVPGIDCIDASAVDTSFLGHSYYASHRTVLSDVFYLIRNGLPPDMRYLEGRIGPGGAYWVFV